MVFKGGSIKMSETNGRWITLKGDRRVFVEEGGSISDAIKKYDAKKGKKIKGAYDKKKHLTKRKRTPKEQAWIDQVVEGHRAYD